MFAVSKTDKNVYFRCLYQLTLSLTTSKLLIGTQQNMRNLNNYICIYLCSLMIYKLLNKLRKIQLLFHKIQNNESNNCSTSLCHVPRNIFCNY